MGEEQSMGPLKPVCIVDEPNHSDDIFTVYHGHSTPTPICGFHEQKIGAGKAGARDA